MRVADYIAQFIAEHEQTAKTVFMVSGGGNMHLIDALGRNGKLRYVCNHHEQACAIAAEGYARVSNKIGIAYVTTGPGGTNAITGVMGAWVDSIPMMIISGQVKFQTTIASQPELKLRQLGDQEINIVDIVRPITKYAVMITDKNSIRYHLEKAVYEAKNGRPGPVWLDVPLDIQGAQIDPESLEGFVPPVETVYDLKIDQVAAALKVAKRPVMIAGNGIALSGAVSEFRALAEKLGIPVLGTFARYDIVKEDNPCYAGRFGTIGHRAGNFAVQNSDLVIALGARLNIRAISYNWEYFGREAIKVVVDIDENELKKHTIEVDIPVLADAGVFIRALDGAVEAMPEHRDWMAQCRRYRETFPTIVEERQKVEEAVDSYNFFDLLSEIADENAVFVFGNGTACVSSYQSLRLKRAQNIVANSGCASMGYDLPAAIGVCYAAPDRQIICVTGDGSMQMNIQELQTIVHNRLPIKLFVLNNEGYISIRNTQKGFFKGHFVGCEAGSGVSCPDTLKIASAYGLKSTRIENQNRLSEQLDTVLSGDDSVVCEVMLNPDEKMEPKLSSEVKPDGRIVSKPLEDMFPFLDRAVFNKQMIIETIDE
ncbi:MAG: thiamine pyrophosphate-binding protein [Chlorobaculum sp.]|jgi:acetolactate synthase-1/2/3 large subunit|nr:thiamine pyrophosphate-binding protein [Chlorobaculum sp.]